MGGSTKDVILGAATGGLYPIVNNQIENIKDAKKTAKAEAESARRAMEAEKKKILDQESAVKLTEERNRQRNMQRQRSISALGRRSTILTTPLGYVNDAQVSSGKTLLGQ